MNAKALKTIVEKYGSYEAYKEWRYCRPENSAKRSLAASVASKASHRSPNANHTFEDKDKARNAQQLSVKSRLAKKNGL